MQLKTEASFKAEFNGGTCPYCDDLIYVGQFIKMEDGRARHATCSATTGSIMEQADAGSTILWRNVSDETLARESRFDAEEARIAPLQRPVCPTCFLELPVSMVCGVC